MGGEEGGGGREEKRERKGEGGREGGGGGRARKHSIACSVMVPRLSKKHTFSLKCSERSKKPHCSQPGLSTVGAHGWLGCSSLSALWGYWRRKGSVQHP